MSSTTLDCTDCGACCFGTHDRYIALLSEDRARAIPQEVTNDFEGRRFMKMSGGHCAQLSCSAEGLTLCSIYEERPEACRAFRAGSFECLKARQYRGHLAAAFREGAAPVPNADEKGPEADLPPAHVIGAMPTGRMKPPV